MVEISTRRGNQVLDFLDQNLFWDQIRNHKRKGKVSTPYDETPCCRLTTPTRRRGQPYSLTYLLTSLLLSCSLTFLLAYSLSYYLEISSPVKNCSSPDDETPRCRLRIRTRIGAQTSRPSQTPSPSSPPV